MIANPFVGVGFHAAGGIAHGSFYVPLKRVRAWAWYAKRRVSFSDALACVRAHLWKESFCLSGVPTDSQKTRRSLARHFAELLCYAQ